MTENIILIDFAGTLVKAEIIEEANELRAQVFSQVTPTKELHADPETLYKMNREFVAQLTGLPADASVRYRMNDLRFKDLTGEHVQNQISTNLFQIGMYMAAKKHGMDIFPAGLIEQLKRIQGLGYKLAIISGVRTDIITGMLAITGCPITFDYVYGQPPILGVKNQDSDVQELHTKGTILYAIGDKLRDLERGKQEGTKTIFVTWGHPSGGEEAYADYTISAAEELEEIIQ